jgi:hypothetical protein
MGYTYLESENKLYKQLVQEFLIYSKSDSIIGRCVCILLGANVFLALKYYESDILLLWCKKNKCPKPVADPPE